MRVNKALLLAGALLFLGCSDFALRAQAPVVTLPGQANSAEGSSTITATNVFQLLWASSANPGSSGSLGHRNGCTILNTSASEQYVYFQGPGMATPTSANSATLEGSAFPLDPPSGTNKQGGVAYCAIGSGLVLQDAIWITGTQGATFVAKQQ